MGPRLRVFDSSPMNLLYLQAADVPSTDIRPYFIRVRNFIRHALDSGGKVYVHCGRGRSRSASMVLAYLVGECGMSLRSAFAHVLRQRAVPGLDLGAERGAEREDQPTDAHRRPVATGGGRCG